MRRITASTLLLITVPLVLPRAAETRSQALSMPLAWLSQAQQSQPQQSPSPTPNPQDRAQINSNIESNLESAFSSDPILDGANIQASVDDVSITITGTVQSEGQHQRALAFASQYAQYRKIVDKITVQ
jgi:osmotically-inducible protein OsmY